jgi:hypothetical protein
MASRQVPPPLRQGDLDALCGIYAIINAMRLAARGHEAVGELNWRLLFEKLVFEADRKARRPTAACGIDQDRLWKLLNRACKQAAKRHGLVLALERPFHREESVSADVTIAWLERALGEPGSAVVIGIGGEYDHWSVVQRMTPHYLTLYDSIGLSRIMLDRCRRESLLDGPSVVSVRLALGCT